MEGEKNSSKNSHAGLYEEVQESFVSNLVRAIRVAGGVSEETGELLHMQKSDLANQSDLSKGTITKLTSPDPHDAKPDLETLCKLGNALNVSPAFLLMTPRDWSLLLQAFGTIEKLVNPKPDEPEPNKYYDRRLIEDEESDHGDCDIDGTLCGESARSAVVF